MMIESPSRPMTTATIKSGWGSWRRPRMPDSSGRAPLAAPVGGWRWFGPLWART